VLGGAFLIPHPAARVTTGVGAVVVGISFVPGVTRLSYDLVGLGPTLWRLSWVVPVAALVGVAGVRLAGYRGPVGRRVGRRAGPWVALAAATVAVVVAGPPALSGASMVAWKAPWQWQRPGYSMTAARAVIDAGSPGDIVLAPRDLAISLDVMTTRIKTVAPRDYFMTYLRGSPGFYYHARMRLFRFANNPAGVTYQPAKVLRALGRVGVQTVCLDEQDRYRLSIVSGGGYQEAMTISPYVCLDRSGSSGQGQVGGRTVQAKTVQAEMNDPLEGR
jgi:hypothetical protein